MGRARVELGLLLEFWTPAWRWRTQQEKARKGTRERLSARLGPELFDKPPRPGLAIV